MVQPSANPLKRSPSLIQLTTGLRVGLSAASRVLPRERSVAVERWLRGYEEACKLTCSDGVVISFGKSGRTWLRVLISRYFARKYGLGEGRLLEFDEFHRSNPALPVLFFTHDNYLKDYRRHDGKFDHYGGSRVVLLIRDPRDVAVSQFFQWKNRMKARKKVINFYPPETTDLAAFVTGREAGLPKIIDFMNLWARDLDRFPDLLLVKYEALRADTRPELARILAFLGQHPSETELADACDYASIDNMRRIERENANRLGANARLKPADAGDPSSFKVRRGKIGGWRDYVTKEQAGEIDAMMRESLSPVFGYR
jgi:hypothetical protein